MTDRVAIYGGSFDPVHLGHLWVAQHAVERLELDRVLFVPAATSPLKLHGPVASDLDRERMLRLALADTTDDRHLPTMFVDDRELRRGGISYSLDTVRELREELPAAELFLLVGSDAFASIRQWHRPTELLGLITPCVFRRGGDGEIDWEVLNGLVSPARMGEIRQAELRLPMIEISSGDIRSRVAQGREIRFLVPSAVREYIASHSLYQPIESPS
jgi:nicotinate-nucleotide adenylyltransferase